MTWSESLARWTVAYIVHYCPWFQYDDKKSFTVVGSIRLVFNDAVDEEERLACVHAMKMKLGTDPDTDLCFRLDPKRYDDHSDIFEFEFEELTLHVERLNPTTIEAFFVDVHGRGSDHTLVGSHDDIGALYLHRDHPIIPWLCYIP
jgi:hypothetical protein